MLCHWRVAAAVQPNPTPYTHSIPKQLDMDARVDVKIELFFFSTTLTVAFQAKDFDNFLQSTLNKLKDFFVNFVTEKVRGVGGGVGMHIREEVDEPHKPCQVPKSTWARWQYVARGGGVGHWWLRPPNCCAPQIRALGSIVARAGCCVVYCVGELIWEALKFRSFDAIGCFFGCLRGEPAPWPRRRFPGNDCAHSNLPGPKTKRCRGAVPTALISLLGGGLGALNTSSRRFRPTRPLKRCLLPLPHQIPAGAPWAATAWARLTITRPWRAPLRQQVR